MMGRMVLANASNGLIYPHDGVCWFQSQHGHHKAQGYFRADAMPWSAVIHMLLGGELEIVDGTTDGKLSDALRMGVPTWCLVFNRALGMYRTRVCDWQTRDMVEVARSNRHRPTAQAIRRLSIIYGWSGPAIVGSNVRLTCHRCWHDDKPAMIAQQVGKYKYVWSKAAIPNDRGD